MIDREELEPIGPWRAIDCSALPAAATWVRLRVYDIAPAGSMVLILAPGNQLLRFGSPEATGLVPFVGALGAPDLYARPVPGNRSFKTELIAYQDAAGTWVQWPVPSSVEAPRLGLLN